MDKLPDLEQVSEQEKEALIVALWAEVQRLRTRLTALEAKLREPRKDARNSSVPPSQTPKANTPRRPPQGLRREASAGRASGGRPLHPTPDQVLMAKAKICPQCRHGVLAAEQSRPAVYDKIELPAVTPIVTRVAQYGGQCATCGQPYVAPVPAGMERGSPFGASVQSLATYLRYTHAISYERLSALLDQVFGLRISEGGLANLFQSVKVRLDDRSAEILTRLRSSRLLCSDETSARVNGQQQWEWVFQNTEVCIHVIRPSRGHGVIQEILGVHRPTIWVSDLYSAQKHHPAEQWQVCLAHQLRDCQFAIDAGDAVFAPRMKAVLLRAFAIHHRRDTLAASTLYQYRCDLRRRVTRCLGLQPTSRHGRRLQKRYAKLQNHLFLFLDDADIPPTNNSSEQAIRMSTVFRKVTNGFRSNWGRDLFAAVRSVVNTGKRQGMSAYQTLQKALSPSSSLFEPG
ncbi:MAG: IS66 family transposase [Candidatus Entotheonellia bacterium]